MIKNHSNIANDLARNDTPDQAKEAPLKLKPQKAGRKPKAPEDKESEVISLKFTKSEMNKLRMVIGLVPAATFIKHHIKIQTDWLK